ncbi:hypothetical protein ACROYT_G027664 [Oculina patagonica]
MKIISRKAFPLIALLAAFFSSVVGQKTEAEKDRDLIIILEVICIVILFVALVILIISCCCFRKMMKRREITISNNATCSQDQLNSTLLYNLHFRCATVSSLEVTKGNYNSFTYFI